MGRTAVVVALPDDELTHAAVALVKDNESAAVANHSIRSYLFAQLHADHLGAVAGRDYDQRLLLLACVMHDIGLSELGNRQQRFEIDGADVAAEFLRGQGLPAHDVDAVWEAIVLHTSPGIAERRGTLCGLVRHGVGMDFGVDTEFLADADAHRIHNAYPRLGMTGALVDEIVAQAQANPEKAPRYSIAGELLRERLTPPYRTGLEDGAAASRWGD